MPETDRKSGYQLNQLKTKGNNLKIRERYLMADDLIAACNQKCVKNMQPDASHLPLTG
jgi:hypothetical protein